MHIKDLFQLLKTLWISSKLKFNHERHRVQLALIIQLAKITENQPSALLAGKSPASNTKSDGVPG